MQLTVSDLMEMYYNIMPYRWVGSGSDFPSLLDQFPFLWDVQRNLTLFENNPQSNISSSKLAVVCVDSLQAIQIHNINYVKFP